MATPVVGDHAKTVLRKEEHLAVPSVGVQWPTMREGYDRPLTPVLVIDLGTVFGGDCVHRLSSFVSAKALAVNLANIVPEIWPFRAEAEAGELVVFGSKHLRKHALPKMIMEVPTTSSEGQDQADKTDTELSDNAWMTT